MKERNKIYRNAEEFGLDLGLSTVEMELIREKRRLIQKLRSKRTKTGLSQKALAKKIGSQQPAIARMESGQVSEVSMDFIVKIALVLKVPLSIGKSKKAA